MQNSAEGRTRKKTAGTALLQERLLRDATVLDADILKVRRLRWDCRSALKSTCDAPNDLRKEYVREPLVAAWTRRSRALLITWLT